MKYINMEEINKDNCENLRNLGFEYIYQKVKNCGEILKRKKKLYISDILRQILGIF